MNYFTRARRLASRLDQVWPDSSTALLVLGALWLPLSQAWAGAKNNPFAERDPLAFVPYSRLIHRAAGVSESSGKNRSADPKAKIAPELLQAYHNMLEKDAPVATYRAERAAYEAGMAYVSSMAPMATTLAPTYDLHNGSALRVTGLTIPNPPGPPDPRLEAVAEEADREYQAAYEKYGDPSEKLPLPEFYTQDTRPAFAITQVGVTTDNRVLALSIGGTNRNLPPRLWLVDARAAVSVLQAGSGVKRNGADYGKLVSFQVVQADPAGRVLLLGTVKDRPAAYPDSPTLMLWTEKEGAQVIAARGDSPSNEENEQPGVGQ